MYLIPYISAVHYRAIVREMIPALERQVSALERSLAAQDSLTKLQDKEIGLLVRQLEDATQAQDTEQKRASLWESVAHDAQRERDRERRWKKRWRLLAAVAGGVAAAGVVL